MGDLLHDDLSVGLRKSADGQMYEAGLLVDGVFHRFAQFKAGGFDHRAKKAAAAAEQSQDGNDPSASQPAG